MNYRIIATLLTAMALSWTSLANAEKVRCSGDAPYSTPTPMTVSFEPGIKGELTLFYPDGSTYLKWGITRLERKVRSGKIIYRDPFDRDGWFLQVASNEVGGEDLKGLLTIRTASFSKVPMTCSITGTPQPPVPTCNYKDEDLIHVARTGTPQQMEEILDCDVDPNYVDSKGCTALLYVMDRSCGRSSTTPGPTSPIFVKQFATLLLDAGANIEARDPKTQETALLKAARFRIYDVTWLLLDLEADVNAQDIKGFTPLMRATESASEYFVKTILSGNPDKLIKNNAGQTAYSIAKEYGYADLLPLLETVTENATIDGKQDGTCSPTMIHLTQGKPVEIILKASNKMFLLTSPHFDLELMAMPGERATKVITPQHTGTFPFSCGVHGAPEDQQTKGSFMVM